MIRLPRSWVLRVCVVVEAVLVVALVVNGRWANAAMLAVLIGYLLLVNAMQRQIEALRLVLRAERLRAERLRALAALDLLDAERTRQARP